MADLPTNIRNRITLPEIDREYTLYEIATITVGRTSQRALGLSQKGSLAVGKDADLVDLSPGQRYRPDVRPSHAM